MDEKQTEWEIKGLKKRTDKLENQVEKIDEDVDILLRFKESTTEKLISLFKTIEDMKNNRQFWSRGLLMAVGGAAITSVFSMVSWVVQSFIGR